MLQFESCHLTSYVSVSHSLDPDGKGNNQSGWLWTYSAPRGDVVFERHISRSREGPREFLKEFQGKLRTDGCGVWESLARERSEELNLIGSERIHTGGFMKPRAKARHAARRPAA